MKKSASHYKLSAKRLDHISPTKPTNKAVQNPFKGINSKEINNQSSQYSQFSMDNYSPEKFTSDVSQIAGVKQEMRYNMEK